MPMEKNTSSSKPKCSVEIVLKFSTKMVVNSQNKYPCFGGKQTCLIILWQLLLLSSSLKGHVDTVTRDGEAQKDRKHYKTKYG